MSDFDTLMNHLRQARSIAASLVGTMSEAEGLHEMIDEAVDFASENCFYVELGAQERRELREDMR